MPIRLSKHIADEMDARGITLAFIERTIESPDREMSDPTDPALTRSFKSIVEFDGRTLRVVHRPDGDKIFVVTSHWDRGARR